MLLAQAGSALVREFDDTPWKEVIERVVATLRRELAAEVWALFRRHEDVVLYSRRVLFVTVTLHVRHARWLVEQIAGEESA